MTTEDTCAVKGCKRMDIGCKYQGYYVCQKHFEMYLNNIKNGWTSKDFLDYIKTRSNRFIRQKTLAGFSCFENEK